MKTEENATNETDTQGVSSSSSNLNVDVKSEGCVEASSSSSTKASGVSIDIAATDRASNYSTATTAPAASNTTSQKRKGKNSYPATRQGDVENGVKLWKN